MDYDIIVFEYEDPVWLAWNNNIPESQMEFTLFLYDIGLELISFGGGRSTYRRIDKNKWFLGIIKYGI